MCRRFSTRFESASRKLVDAWPYAKGCRPSWRNRDGWRCPLRESSPYHKHVVYSVSMGFFFDPTRSSHDCFSGRVEIANRSHAFLPGLAANTGVCLTRLPDSVPARRRFGETQCFSGVCLRRCGDQFSLQLTGKRRRLSQTPRHQLPPRSVGYRIASLFPGAAAFLTSLSSRTPLSYLASHADSSSSTGSVKLR